MGGRSNRAKPEAFLQASNPLKHLLKLPSSVPGSFQNVFVDPMKGTEQQGDKSCFAGDGSVLGQPPQVAGADLWVIAQLCYFQEEQDGKEIQGLAGRYVSFPLCRSCEQLVSHLTEKALFTAAA